MLDLNRKRLISFKDKVIKMINEKDDLDYSKYYATTNTSIMLENDKGVFTVYPKNISLTFAMEILM